MPGVLLGDTLMGSRMRRHWALVVGLVSVGLVTAAIRFIVLDDIDRVPCALSTDAFNTGALRANVPLFWIGDTNHDRALDASELRVLSFYPTSDLEWMTGTHLTPVSRDAVSAITSGRRRPQPMDPLDVSARAALDGITLSLVDTDASVLGPSERAFVARMLQIATLFDALLQRQLGVDRALAALRPDDTEIRSLLRMHHDIDCGARSHTDSHSAPDIVCPVLDVYPDAADVATLCATLAAAPNADALLGPFSVVRQTPDGYTSVPYRVAYHDLTAQLAESFRGTARSLDHGPEAPLIEYLLAVAAAFETDSWGPVREAAALARAAGSRWYVDIRVQPLPRDPCWGSKAAFGIIVGMRDDASFERLVARGWPRLAELDPSLAAQSPGTSGRSYPGDVVHPIFAAGATRTPSGAVIGTTSRDATVLMPDFCGEQCRGARMAALAAILDRRSFDTVGEIGAEETLLETAVHELAHRLAPSHDLGSPGDGAMPVALRAALQHRVGELLADAVELSLVGQLRAHGTVSAAESRAMSALCILDILAALSETESHRDFDAVLPAVLRARGGIRYAHTPSADGQHEDSVAIDFDALERVARELADDLRADFNTHALRSLGARLDETAGEAEPFRRFRSRFSRYRSVSVVYSVGW